jgi:hypothetical protein
LLRSFAFDPGLLTSHLFDAEHLARLVAEELGKTRDRIFTPMVTRATFLGRRPLLPGGRRPPDRLACRPWAAPILGRHRRLL